MAVIIYPPTLEARGFMERPHHLLWEASRRGHAVIFCNAAQSAERAMEKVGDRFYICHNFEALLRQTFPQAVLYFTRPEHARLAGAMGTARAIYDAAERAPDPAALAAATDVWVASEALRAGIRASRPDALVVPNAADRAHWAAAPAAEPLGAAVLPRPRVAFVGPVDGGVDLDALYGAAEAMPEASFLVVGPVRTRGWAERRLPANVHPLGERSYASLPAYAHAAGALVVPCRGEGPGAPACAPAMLWEALATGRPVVCSGVTESPVPAVAAPDLAEALRAALRGGDAGARERREIAGANTWEARWQAAAAALEGAA